MGRKKFELFKKTIKAPSYFKEHQIEVDRIDKFCADLCGMSVEWWREQMKTEHFSETFNSMAKERGLTEKQMKQAERLSGAAIAYKGYCAAKFQDENIDTQWGLADYIQYNKETDELELKWLKEKLKKMAKKVFLSDKEKKPSLLKKGIKQVKDEVLDKKKK